MKHVKILLLQVREGGDPMLDHEAVCVHTRLQGVEAEIELIQENAVTHPAETQWLEDVDGVIIGGSGAFSVHHPKSQRWVKPLHHILDEVFEKAIPTFGICFGHQLIGAHLGAPILTSDPHSELGTLAFRLTDQGRRDAIFGTLPNRFHGQTGHSDYVTEIPSGVHLLAESDAVEAQAFKVDDLPVYTTQFHPDLQGHEARERYLHSQGVCFETASEELLEQIEHFHIAPCDASNLLAWFVERLVKAADDE